MFFKSVPDFPNYSISDSGVLKNRHGRILKCGYNRKNGYKYHILYNKKNGVRGRYNLEVHRIMRKTFLNNPYGLTDCDHKNRDKQDNRLYNLRLVSRSGNQQNRTINGNNTSGYKNIQRRGKYWRFEKTIDRKKITKSFKQLEDALVFKTNYLTTNNLPLF